MVVIPAGNFMMGAPENDPMRTFDEVPQHRVSFAKPFSVGRFAVTFAEWDACVADGGCNGYMPSDGGWGRERRPVINVSWNDAQSYLGWLSRKTGQPYRLLSEAEREFVSRAGTSTAFWWGDSVTTDQANYNGGGEGVHRGQTVPVDAFQPNPFGLYQVHGNVYDWVEDCWHSSYTGSLRGGRAWTTEDCPTRVIRGGSWKYNSFYLRSASRKYFMPFVRQDYVGFRVARALNP
jgi:formylglycine-generating enzyme required for sulfatase activity